MALVYKKDVHFEGIDVMQQMTVKEARSHFSSLLNHVGKGREIEILRRGKKVARLVAPSKKRACLPDLSEFRASVRIKGKPLSRLVVEARTKERY